MPSLSERLKWEVGSQLQMQMKRAVSTLFAAHEGFQSMDSTDVSLFPSLRSMLHLLASM